MTGPNVVVDPNVIRFRFGGRGVDSSNSTLEKIVIRTQRRFGNRAVDRYSSGKFGTNGAGHILGMVSQSTQNVNSSAEPATARLGASVFQNNATPFKFGVGDRRMGRLRKERDFDIVLMDDEFDKKLTGEQIREFKTVKDILDFMD